MNMLDLLPLGLLGLCLWRLRPAKPFLTQLHDDCLSTDSTASLRGLLALVVIFSHLTIWRSDGVVFPLFGRVGYPTVAVFFFLSGYGLQKQNMTRDDYAKGFLAKRLFTVVLPYAVVTGLYWGYYLWLGRDYSWQRVVTALVSGEPIVSFSWYVLAMLLFYGAFWVIMRLCGRRYGAMVLCGVAWYGFYTAFCVLMGYGSWWYVSAFPVVIGMFWAVYEQRIWVFLCKYYFPALLVALAGFGAAFLASGKLSALPVFGAIADAVTATLFAVTVILLMYKLRLGNPVLHFLGQLSMELYLMHGLAMMLWNNPVVRIENSLLYCVLVVLTAVLLALILHIAFKGMPNKKPTR